MIVEMCALDYLDSVKNYLITISDNRMNELHYSLLSWPLLTIMQLLWLRTICVMHIRVNV